MESTALVISIIAGCVALAAALGRGATAVAKAVGAYKDQVRALSDQIGKLDSKWSEARMQDRERVTILIQRHQDQCLRWKGSPFVESKEDPDDV